MKQDVLPNSRARTPRKVVMQGATAWIPIYCANCGGDGGLVMENEMDFAFYLCDPCAEKWGIPAGCMATPDEVFWAKVKAAQIEKYGRELTPGEVARELDDETSILTQLSKEK